MNPTLNNCQFKQLEVILDHLSKTKKNYMLYINDLLMLSKFFNNEFFSFDEIENLFLDIWSEKMKNVENRKRSKGKKLSKLNFRVNKR